MPIIQILITLIVVGFVLWIVNAVIPMDSKIKMILNAFVALLVVLWLLSMIFPGLSTYHLTR